MPDPSNKEETVQRLKQEIDRLMEQQHKALKSAVYVPMTPDEAQECDARREKIAQLIDQLLLLEKAPGQCSPTP